MSSSVGADSNGSEYWPIHIARSDGQGYTNLDNFPLSDNDGLDVEARERWEVIVAGHLQKELGPKDDKKQYKLAGFPKGYELRRSVRKDGTTRDYYLYGHPHGPKAAYRAPGEFAHHALWLVSNSTDNKDCPCRLCPTYLTSFKGSRERGQGTVQLPPQAQTQAQQHHQQQQPQQQQQSQQHQREQGQLLQQHPQHQQLQQSHPPLEAGVISWTNVFRVGELVWYRHTAWRLGVIMAIVPSAGNVAPTGGPDSSYLFQLAPLGHTLLEQTPLIKDSQSMRPFLTFSVPNVTSPELHDAQFANVDWRSLTERLSLEPDPARRENDRQLLGLDASKMGARAINDVFSTFHLLNQGTTQDGSLFIQTYAGVYLGAEMVCVGDPLRVTNPFQASSAPNSGSPEPTLVIHVAEILVLSPQLPNTGREPALRFKGNLYRIVRSPATQPPPQDAVPDQAVSSLGPAFAEELATRNTLEATRQQQSGTTDGPWRWFWILAASDVTLGEPEVLGRFYVTTRLMNILDPARYQQWVQAAAGAAIDEPPAYLNARPHSGAGNFAGRRVNRAAAIGDAVSVRFQAPEGMLEE
ncbi:hypothetical protein VTJ49DRAFT_4684 [Mycothermus thermophilus]|uniref:Cryptic loci regulator 2 N-terminal domain-containing protein n=1 Tax=Humicola insolens TaxID=85995 RepID=A0ABR3VMD5_HUMIN